MQERQMGNAWQERAAKIFVALSVIGVGYLVFSKLLLPILPFLLAFLLSLIIRPCAAFLERKCRIPRRVGAFLLLVLLLFLLGWLVMWGCRRLFSEAQQLLDHIGNGGDLLGARMEQALEVLSGLTEHIPFLSHLKARESLADFWAQVDAKLADMIAETVSRWTDQLPDLIARVVRGVPGAVFFLITFLFSSFYLCADGDRIVAALLSRLPVSIRERIVGAKTRLAGMGGRYLRAYFLLFLLTYLELLVGFSVIGLTYTVLPAFIISLVDILPVLGVGSVLVPWGLIELLRGNVTLGTGLLILCGVMVLLRQFVEPRIIGGSLGLHPLATLFAAYVGLELFGLFGMLLGPAVALVVKNLLEKEAYAEETS